MNGHIQTIMQMQISKSRNAYWSGPRMSTAAPQIERMMIGISSFAFQGTNAHAVAARISESVESMECLVVPWRRIRVWVSPEPNMLSSRGILIKSRQGHQARFDGEMFSARTSYVRDHYIKGLNLVPASMFIECASSGVTMMSNEDSAAIYLKDLMFSTPVIIDQNSGSKVRPNIPL